MTRPTPADLLRDLRDESDDLLETLQGLEPSDWRRPTPSAGWDVQDQVHHLAFFDDATVLALRDPDAFRAQATDLAAGGDDFVDRAVAAARGAAPEASLNWWRSSRADVVEALARAEPSGRLPWYGPDMSTASAVTARIMESWAHGHDVREAVGRPTSATHRLRHVCHLGYQTRTFSHRLHGQQPGGDVHVVLAGPDGALWRWGPEDAQDSVHGSALDFALVVTQRRHVHDTTLEVHGSDAARWLALAQAYAGPPGTGRRPAGVQGPGSPR